VWDNGERERQQQVKLWWCGALAREEVKWRMEVRRFEEDSLRRWCGFNASVSAWDRMQRDKALPEDEAEAAILSWLNEKKVWHNAAAWWRRPEERWYQGWEREETATVGLIRILLGRKMKKIHAIDSAGTKGRWRFKSMIS
jgi:hypothetical protein